MSKRFWLGFGDVKVGQEFTWQNPWARTLCFQRMVKVSPRKYMVLKSTDPEMVGRVFRGVANTGVDVRLPSTK